MKRLFLFLLLFILVACEPIKDGIVDSKTFIPERTEYRYQTIIVGRTTSTVRVPYIVREQFFVTIKFTGKSGKLKERLVIVDKEVFEELEIGQFYPNNK
ncbi:MAG: hypothetical protein ACRCZB_04930 [Bacteroidales bacterium]